MPKTSSDGKYIETEGEQAFERFLRANKLRFRRHVTAGDRHPDFLLKGAHGLVLCEVRDLNECDLDRKVLKDKLHLLKKFGFEPAQKYRARFHDELKRVEKFEAASAGKGDPFPRLQRIIDKKRDQMSALRGRIPCVIVLYNNHSFPHEAGIFMRHGVASNRYFGPSFNRTISAIAVLDLLFPNRKKIDALVAARHAEIAGDRPYGGVTDRDFLLELWPKLEQYKSELLAEIPEGYIEEERLRLRVYHNQFALKPLGKNALSCVHNLEIDHLNLNSLPIDQETLTQV